MDASAVPPAGLWAKAQGFVAARPAAAIAIMVVACISTVFVIVYYRGIGPLGPYAAAKFAPAPREEEEEVEEAPRKRRSASRRKRHVPPAGSDSETEDLASQIEDQIEETN